MRRRGVAKGEPVHWLRVRGEGLGLSRVRVEGFGLRCIPVLVLDVVVPEKV